MCGSRRARCYNQAYAHGCDGYGSRYNHCGHSQPMTYPAGAAGVSAVMSMVSNILNARSASQYPAMSSAQRTDNSQDSMSATHPDDMKPSGQSEKSQMKTETPAIVYRAMEDEKQSPPAYAEANSTTSRSTPRAVSPSAAKVEHPPVIADRTVMAEAKDFDAPLSAFRAGHICKRTAKRIAREFVDDMYKRGLEERRVMNGGELVCGDRCQVWRETKPVKKVLRQQIKAVKQDIKAVKRDVKAAKRDMKAERKGWR